MGSKFVLLFFLLSLSSGFSADESNRIPLVVNGKTFFIQNGPKEGKEKEAFDSLSNEDREKFENRRVLYLQKLASLLLSGKKIPNKILSKFLKTSKPTDVTESTDSTIPSRFSVIQEILSTADSMMWEGSKVVVHSNRYGVQLSTGVLASIGYLNRGIGLGTDIGVSLAYDFHSKDWRVEFTQGFERLGSVLGFNARLTFPRVSVSFFIEADKGEAETIARHGTHGYFWLPVQPNVTSKRLYLRRHFEVPLQIPLSVGQLDPYSEYPLLAFNLRGKFPYVSKPSGAAVRLVTNPIGSIIDGVVQCKGLFERAAARFKRKPS